MSPNVLALLVVLASVAAWAAFMAYTALAPKVRRHDMGVSLPEKEEVLAASKAAPGGPDYVREVNTPEPRVRRRGAEDVKDVSRRKLLNRFMGGTLMVGLAQFGLASLDFLYPRLRGGFGAKITVGEAEDIRKEIAVGRDPKFIPDGRFYIALFEGDPAEADKVPAYRASNAGVSGFVALYRKCVHLGCSVPWCASAKWFECPCHGSKYSVNGEYRDGPAPRSLDQFRTEIVGGKLIVDTSQIIEGAPRGTITSQPQPEGIHCVDVREG